MLGVLVVGADGLVVVRDGWRKTWRRSVVVWVAVWVV